MGLPAKKEKIKPKPKTPKDEEMGREKFPGTESAQMYWMQRQSNMPIKIGMRNEVETS